MKNKIKQLALRKLAKGDDRMDYMDLYTRSNAAAMLDGVKPVTVWDQLAAQQYPEYYGKNTAALMRLFPYHVASTYSARKRGPFQQAVYRSFFPKSQAHYQTPYYLDRLYDRNTTPARRKQIMDAFDADKRGDADLADKILGYK